MSSPQPDNDSINLYTEKSQKKLDLAPTIQAIKDKTGSSVGFFSEWAKLNFGPGRIMFNEYLEMRLWDTDFYPREGLKEFVGHWQARKVWQTANFVPGLNALATNKIATAAVLGAYGLPVPPMAGLHAAGALPGPGRTSTPETLEAFLLNDLAYPAFGKPLSGIQSLGSVSLQSCEKSTGLITKQDGGTIGAAELAKEIHAAYAKDGYIFQPRLIPHDDVRALIGERIACLRVLTIMRPEGPAVFRACWKIPTGKNWVDNFWRPGNLLASVDIADGAIRRVISGTGLTMAEVYMHPDTSVRLTGVKVPLWEKVCATALAGAAAMADFGVLGWDIAVTAAGPVIIEINDTPDLIMHQISDRRGIMEPVFQQFLAERRRGARDLVAVLRDRTRKEYAPGMKFAAK
jgi:hypothetical protein